MSKARTTAEGATGKVKTSLEAAITDAEALLTQVEASAERDNLLGAINLVRHRLAFALSVMDAASATDLDQLISNVRDKSAKPPCKLWEALISLLQLEENIQTSFDDLAASEDCDKEKIAEALKSATKLRDPIQDLAKSLTGATKDLKTAQKNTGENGACKGQGQSSRQASRRQRPRRRTSKHPRI